MGKPCNTAMALHVYHNNSTRLTLPAIKLHTKAGKLSLAQKPLLYAREMAGDSAVYVRAQLETVMRATMLRKVVAYAHV